MLSPVESSPAAASVCGSDPVRGAYTHLALRHATSTLAFGHQMLEDVYRVSQLSARPSRSPD